MTARRIGLFLGPLAFALAALTAPPAGMSEGAWLVAGLTLWMAAWWMTEAMPLAVTAMLPFVILPLAGVSDAETTASTYYSPILFLLLGGAFIALAIERTGMHRRLALAILRAVGADGGPVRLLVAFMLTAALLSMFISNTSTTLIMMPMALAVLEGGSSGDDEGAAPLQTGIHGALPMGIAFAASIGGLGTIVGSPTNAIAVGVLDKLAGVRITFAEWSLYGIPLVLLSVPLAAFIVARVQRVAGHPFDVAAARAAIDGHVGWTAPEKRLVPIALVTFIAWVTQPLVAAALPVGAWTDGTIAIIAALALFLLPDGTGRPLLVWHEAERAPWSVIFMFGGGLALAAGMSASGLAKWIGAALLPLEAWPLVLVALAVTVLVIVITEFASNVAAATGIIPVVASLVVALGVDPVLLALPAALAASWGFMLPAGTGPNAIAWATGRIRIGAMVTAGALLDVAGAVLIVAVVWGIAALV
ncbi:MAG: DASS family sodium-coupled anion symporter [Erythrobacter sp.]|uniref:SLC13 family permease n=1 Tax=Erythrobacter sp. TaxID=1042 RepID=UPI0025FB0724|nr:DASS family sodium-coupled anion symporter [Erythrobacter sp.]MCL9998282.1 DASS family sodium-coupled anion symporter [Erythrobacter sp.]